MGRFSPMDVVFDTGSDWLVIEADNCGTCTGNTYNADQSGVQTGTGISERSYGAAYLEGTEYKDTVCCLLSACVSNFEYFAIYNQVGLQEPIDGILGLARGGSYFYLGDLTRNPGPLYIDGMIRSNLISDRKFSFYFTLSGNSYVDFGQPQDSAMRNRNDLRYINLLDDFYWSAFNQAVAVGNTDPSNAYGYENVSYNQEYENKLYSIFDTGTSSINFSALYFDDFIEKIFDYVGGDDYRVI